MAATRPTPPPAPSSSAGPLASRIATPPTSKHALATVTNVASNVQPCSTQANSLRHTSHTRYVVAKSALSRARDSGVLLPALPWPLSPLLPPAAAASDSGLLLLRRRACASSSAAARAK